MINLKFSQKILATINLPSKSDYPLFLFPSNLIDAAEFLFLVLRLLLL